MLLRLPDSQRFQKDETTKRSVSVSDRGKGGVTSRTRTSRISVPGTKPLLTLRVVLGPRWYTPRRNRGGWSEPQQVHDTT